MFSHLSRLLLALAVFAAAEAGPASAQAVSFALPPSLIQDMSIGQKKFVNEEFPIMLKDFTGLEATVHLRDSLETIGKNLAAGTDQFAILQGVEYGWLKAKYADLQPLIIGIYHVRQPKAILLTKKDDAAMSFADLKGRPIALLKAGKEYIPLFAKKGAGGDLKSFFGKIVESSNAEAVLDDVLLGKVAAAIVDQASLENYKDVNPGRFARLRTIEESPPFPPMAVFYMPNKVAAETVTKMRTGMLSANASARSRDAMSSFKITAFEAVPADYAKWVADIVKAYPQPK
jgi:ABC-type phosphate/phosphonate transport system substrate-binding protein